MQFAWLLPACMGLASLTTAATLSKAYAANSKCAYFRVRQFEQDHCQGESHYDLKWEFPFSKILDPKTGSFFIAHHKEGCRIGGAPPMEARWCAYSDGFSGRLTVEKTYDTCCGESLGEVYNPPPCHNVGSVDRPLPKCLRAIQVHGHNKCPIAPTCPIRCEKGDKCPPTADAILLVGKISIRRTCVKADGWLKDCSKDPNTVAEEVWGDKRPAKRRFWEEGWDDSMLSKATNYQLTDH